ITILLDQREYATSSQDLRPATIPLSLRGCDEEALQSMRRAGQRATSEDARAEAPQCAGNRVTPRSPLAAGTPEPPRLTLELSPSGISSLRWRIGPRYSKSRRIRMSGRWIVCRASSLLDGREQPISTTGPHEGPQFGALAPLAAFNDAPARALDHVVFEGVFH